MEQNSKISKFLDTVHADAEKKRDQIIKEAEAVKEEEISKAKQKADVKKSELLEAAEEKLAGDLGRRISSYNAECRHKLLETRVKIKNRVFTEARQKLLEFANSDKYIDKLLDYTADGCKKLSDIPVTVFVKPEDERFSKELIKNLPMGSRVETDDKIEIGGLKMLCRERKVILDYTFDTNLDSQSEWFLTESKLVI